jgi:hypothetical protein
MQTLRAIGPLDQFDYDYSLQAGSIGFASINFCVEANLAMARPRREAFPRRNSVSLAMLAAMRRASGLVVTPPLFLCCLPCRVTGIAGRLLFSLQQGISFCLFGRFARCLIGGRPRGVGCCLRSNLGLLCKFALLALPHFFTPRRALGSRSGNGLALLSFLDGGRPFDERHFEFCQHQLLGLGCVFEPLFQVRDASIAHEIVLMLLVRPAGENGEIGGIA